MTDFPIPGINAVGVEQSFPSILAGVASTGRPSNLLRPRSRVSMQVSFTTGGATVKVQLQGTIDGVNWMNLATFDTGAGSASGDIVTSSSHVVGAVRALAETVSAGTCTATILAAGPNS